MTPEQKDELARNSLRNVVDLLQLLKYSLEWFKDMEFHKAVDPKKNLRPDCAKLIQSLNGFLFAMKNKTGNSKGGVLRIMQRDQLHDLSLLLDETYDIENLPDLIEGIKRMKIDRIAELQKTNPDAA